MASPSAKYTQPLAGLRAADASSFGGKSASLGELLEAGLPVPPGFAVSTAAFQAFVEEAGLGPTIEEALAPASPDDVEAIAAAARTIGEAMRSAPVPGAVSEEVARSYSELADAEALPAPPVAVRSSALGEDGADATYAGQQESYLWVRGVQDVCDALRECWISLYSPTAISYRARLGPAPEGPAMGVTVQLMVDAEVSGVMFTCNPLSGDPSMVAINASWGLGLSVVGGEVTPDDYLVSKITSEVVRENVNTKELQYVPDPAGRGTVRVEVPEALRESRCLDAPALAGLVALARRVERHFGGHQDIEWAIARDDQAPDRLFVLQSRPVTGLPTEQAKPPAASAIGLVMNTFGADRARVEPEA